MALGTAQKNKKFNFGNPSGQFARKIGEGEKAEMTVYDLQELMPPARNGQEYEGDPYLYLICENADGKRGLRVRCTSEECLEAIINSKKNEFPVTVTAEKFLDPNTKQDRFYLSLESWG